MKFFFAAIITLMYSFNVHCMSMEQGVLAMLMKSAIDQTFEQLEKDPFNKFVTLHKSKTLSASTRKKMAEYLLSCNQQKYKRAMDIPNYEMADRINKITDFILTSFDKFQQEPNK